METGVIARLIGASARNPWPTLVVVAALAGYGWWSMLRSPLDALPDLSDQQVVVVTEWQGRSTQLVEDHVTYPITTALLSAPGVQTVRGQSFFGLSFVYVLFDEGTDLYWARSRVVEALTEVRARLPAGVTPTLGPDATGVGWIFQYALVDESGQSDLAALRAVQDWNLRYALESVPGVAQVATVGGMVKQLQVTVDPQRLAAHDLMLGDVVEAVQASNEDGGGRVLEIAGHEHMVRSRGTLTNEEDLRAVPIAARRSGVGAMSETSRTSRTSGARRASEMSGASAGPATPLRLGDVATVAFGPDMQSGIADLDGRGEVVGGIVVMRQGENALRVIHDVKERLRQAAPSLPDGTRVEIVYDRSELIDAAIGTLRRTLLEEALIVSLVILLFLLHARSAVIVIITLPIAVLLAFIPMVAQGITANIMSLGGIAVAVGALVDASIIIIENVHRRLAEWDARGETQERGERGDVVIKAMQEVGPSIFFSLLVITASFLPVFALEATEGRLFKPLAFTKTYAMAFGAILAVTLTPALAALLLRGGSLRGGRGGRFRTESEHPLTRRLMDLYAPVVRWAVDHHRRVVVIAGALLVVTVPVFFSLEREFMPPLNEGSLLNMPSSPPGMSATEAGNVLQAADRAIAAVPEVKRVFGKIGRAETATDPAPMSMMETTILLKPRDEWRPGLTWQELVRELDAAVQVPGMPNLWWMPIQTRVEMLSTGVRSPLAVQVFGDDPESIERAAVGIEGALRDIAGTRSVVAERSAAAGFIDIVLDRERAAQHGVRSRDLTEATEAALGGMKVTELLDPHGRRRYPVNVRYARELRDDPDELGRVLVETAGGAQVPISQVADVVHRTGPDMLRSEDGRLVGLVFVDPGARAIGDWLDDATPALEQHLTRAPLPAGMHVAWTGQYRHMERASQRLLLVVPLTLLLVFALLWINTRSLAQTMIVLLAVPFSLIGAVWLVWLLDYHLSVAVWVGLIALAGLDAETGVVMLLYLKLAHARRAAEGRLQTADDMREAIVEGAAHRLRPKLMTVLCLMIGLTPLLWSDGAGADVMKRIAAPMVGGLVTSFLLELTVYPAVFAWWRRPRLAPPS